MIVKFLDNEFNQLPWGVDVTNELTSIRINNTMSDGSSMTVKAPLTKNTRYWVEQIRQSMISNDGNSAIIMADTTQKQNYFIVDSASIKIDKNNNSSYIQIVGLSADKLLQTRLSVKKTYDNESLSSIIEDMVKGAGLGGELSTEYPYSIGDGDVKEDRYVSICDLEINIQNDLLITYETEHDVVGSYISDLIKTYGKRMYSVYDDVKRKLIIKIDDGGDKTISNTGLKNIISSDSNTISSIDYNINRNERINVICYNQADSTYGVKEDVSLNNPTSGLNRREAFVSMASYDDEDGLEQSLQVELTNSEDALEKVNVSAQFENNFDYGIYDSQVFIGDFITIALVDENNNRILVNDVLSSMDIIIETSKTSSLQKTFIPKIGTDDTDDDGNFVTRRQKINIKSAKNAGFIRNK